jgi:hypothetical protein
VSLLRGRDTSQTRKQQSENRNSSQTEEASHRPTSRTRRGQYLTNPPRGTETEGNGSNPETSSTMRRHQANRSIVHRRRMTKVARGSHSRQVTGRQRVNRSLAASQQVTDSRDSQQTSRQRALADKQLASQQMTSPAKKDSLGSQQKASQQAPDSQDKNKHSRGNPSPQVHSLDGKGSLENPSKDSLWPRSSNYH